MKTVTKRIVVSALFAALVCVSTVLVKIPSPLNGYLHLGDGAVLLSAWVLSPVYGIMAAGLGSALADLFAGYVVYAPATFLIKGLMAAVAYAVHALLAKRINGFLSGIISGALAESVMIIGYFLFEGFLYGFVPSLVNIPANGIQALAGIVIGVIALMICEKQNITKRLQ